MDHFNFSLSGFNLLYYFLFKVFSYSSYKGMKKEKKERKNIFLGIIFYLFIIYMCRFDWWHLAILWVVPWSHSCRNFEIFDCKNLTGSVQCSIEVSFMLNEEFINDLNSRKSDGVRSGLYGGCINTSQPSSQFLLHGYRWVRCHGGTPRPSYSPAPAGFSQ